MQVEIYKDKAAEWRWRKVAANGRIVAESGEGYTRYADALEAAEKFGDGETITSPGRDEKDRAEDAERERLDRQNEEKLRRQERVDPK